LITSSLSCASLVSQLPPSLKNRSLRISRLTNGGLEYQWQECVQHGLFGNCKKVETKVETYDLNNFEVRNKLIDMGFVVSVEEKVSIP
jgi:hypothetical protein